MLNDQYTTSKNISKRSKKNQSLPKIRKAKSQSFRSRRNPSERTSPINPQDSFAQQDLSLNELLVTGKGQDFLTPKSPLHPHHLKSPSSISRNISAQTTSRHGTLRLSKSRQGSIAGSMVFSPVLHSPVGLSDRSSQGRRSPLLISSEVPKSPNDVPLRSTFGASNLYIRSPTGDQVSPTYSCQTQIRRSPIGAVVPFDFTQRKVSPRSTAGIQNLSFECSFGQEENFTIQTSTGFYGINSSSINLFTPTIFSADKKSPIGPIPPITISNPQESHLLAEKKAADVKIEEENNLQEKKVKSDTTVDKIMEKEQPEKKSVMREILAFVRKPSKHISTRTNRFAHAFTRAESGSSGGPLIRQSTFSASPAASSSAAKSAITKQMSEVEFEPKMSLKLSHYAKMSLKLRRSTRDEDKVKQARTDTIQSTVVERSLTADGSGSTDGSGRGTPLGDIPFEFANVHFEKVGNSYIKHDKARDKEEEDVFRGTTSKSADIDLANLVEEINNSVKLVALTNETTQLSTSHFFQRRSESREPIEPRISEERESDSNDIVIPEDFRVELSDILRGYKPEPIYVNLDVLRKEIEEAEAAARKAAETTAAGTIDEKYPIQCPIIEFEPASRRSSYNPPRSPLLKSPAADIDTDFITLHRLDSGGDSFEIIEGDRKSSRAESSFECPYSSRETSFDISRYQSTSYEDQSSSFEIVDMDEKSKKSSVDLRKSSIELLDVETFQRSSFSGGRKSSLETHFDYTPSEMGGTTSARSPNFPITKKHRTESFRTLQVSSLNAFSRARSPLSNQTSSNYSSRDSYESSSSCAPPICHQSESIYQQRCPHDDAIKKHFPITIKGKDTEIKTFFCTDQRCATIFEPRPSSTLTQYYSTAPMSTSTGFTKNTSRVLSAVGCATGFSSGSEFEPPSPRRATSASPKHTFTFRLVLKKVESSPDALYKESHRGRIVERYRRRDSRRKHLQKVTEKV